MRPNPSVENYRRIQTEIATVATRCHRDPKEITLIIASKGHAWEELLPLYEAGCRHFGENRLQDALPKMAHAPDDIHWHMIGTLQKNKVRKALDAFSLIHSVDTSELVYKIAACSAEAGEVTPILLEVNTSGESSKHGLSSQGWLQAYHALAQLASIRIEGLMTMAPLQGSETEIATCFQRLRALRDQLRQQTSSHPMVHLSMGMSHDYQLAIEAGATFLRIGSAIFHRETFSS